MVFIRRISCVADHSGTQDVSVNILFSAALSLQLRMRNAHRQRRRNGESISEREIVVADEGVPDARSLQLLIRCMYWILPPHFHHPKPKDFHFARILPQSIISLRKFRNTRCNYFIGLNDFSVRKQNFWKFTHHTHDTAWSLWLHACAVRMAAVSCVCAGKKTNWFSRFGGCFCYCLSCSVYWVWCLSCRNQKHTNDTLFWTRFWTPLEQSQSWKYQACGPQTRAPSAWHYRHGQTPSAHIK